MQPRTSTPSTPSPVSPADEASRRALTVVTLLLIASALVALRTLLPAVLLGAWLAAVCEPYSARLARGIGGRERSAAVLVLAVGVAFVALAAVLILPVISDARQLINSLRPLMAAPSTLHNFGHAWSERQGAHSDIAAIMQRVRDYAPIAELAVGTIASVVLQAFTFVFTAYYLAIDGRRLIAGLERVSPLGPIPTRRFIATFLAVGRGIACSVGGSAVITGVLMAGAFLAAGTPRPMLLAAAAGVASLLPTGAHIVWIPAAVLLLAQGRTNDALILAFVGLVGVGGFVDHVLRPWLVRFGRLSMHPLLLLLGLFGGIVTFGPWGVFLGPLLVAMTGTAVSLHVRGPVMSRRSLVPGVRITQMPEPSVRVPVAVEPIYKPGV